MEIYIISIYFFVIFLLIIFYKYKGKKNDSQVLEKPDKIIEYEKFTNILENLKRNKVEEKFIEKFNCEYFNKINYKIYNYILESLNNKPINIVNKFLSDFECNQLISNAKNRFKNSTVGFEVHQKDNRIRDSRTAIFDKSENYLIGCIENRIAKLLNVNKSRIENLQLTRYDQEQFYSFHHDYVSNLKDQRKYSIIIYLNTLNEGKTHFPYYNYKSYPEKGKLLYFTNLFEDNSENILTLHQSEKILSNKTKYVLVSWISI